MRGRQARLRCGDYSESRGLRPPPDGCCAAAAATDSPPPGASQLDNVLLIGMTNRRDLIDRAMLRPGRIEVSIELFIAPA